MAILFGDRLDRYVGRNALGSFLAALFFVVLLFSLIDLLINLPSYLREGEKTHVATVALFWKIVQLQVLSVPIVFVTLAPFATVISAMFAVSAHFAVNEIAPMLFCGRSMLRILRPVLVLAMFSALSMAACWEWIVPRVSQPLANLRAELTGDDQEQKDLVVKLRDGVDQTIFVKSYDHDRQRMDVVTLVDRGSGANDVVTITASAAQWDPSLGDWRLVDGERRVPDAVQKQLTLGAPTATPDLLFQLGKEGRETMQLSYSELLELRALRPGRRDLQMAFQSRFTFPLANLVLLMLALPFAVSYERGRRIERVVFAILLCGLYLVTDLTCQSLGSTVIHPVLAAWFPTIVFGAFGAVFFVGVRT